MSSGCTDCTQMRHYFSFRQSATPLSCMLPCRSVDMNVPRVVDLDVSQ